MSFIRDNPVVYLVKKTWKYSKGNRANVVLYFFLFVVANTVGMMRPLVFAHVLNILQLEGLTAVTLPMIGGYLALFIVITVVFWSLHGPARYLERMNAFLMRVNYKKYLLDGTMALSVDWHTNHHSGSTIDKIEKGSRALMNFASNGFQIVEALVRLTVAYVILVYFNVHSAYIVAGMILITLVLVLNFDTVLDKVYRVISKIENVISAKVYDSISNITTVIILRVERLVSKSIIKEMMSPYPMVKRHGKLAEVKWSLVSLAASVMIFLVLFSYVYSNYVAGTVILIGTLSALMGYVDSISNLFFRFAWMWGDIVFQRARVANSEELSEEFSEKKKVRQVKFNGWKELEIRGLNFSYHTEEGADLHLDDINMTIKRNQRIALIGYSGSGKTTLLKLFRDLYQPRLGTVYLDGELLKDGFASISSKIALIPQDPEIFNATIKENITLGVGRNLYEIQKFTDMAEITRVIDKLPKKLNSSIVEKGVNLSGGQKQRLALSRGLMASQDKEIVLLDEATSSVDVKNETKIYLNIFRKFKNKTVIASIHRLRLLPMFDVVYFFKDGKIVASGTFDQLLKKNREIREIWRKYVKEHKK